MRIGHQFITQQERELAYERIEEAGEILALLCE